MPEASRSNSSGASAAISAGARADSGRGENRASPSGCGRWFQGQTSWQTSQPKIRPPKPDRNGTGTTSGFSMLWYEMQRRASTTPGAGNAPVGQAPRQSVQSPQRRSDGVSYASTSRSTNITDSVSHD